MTAVISPLPPPSSVPSHPLINSQLTFTGLHRDPRHPGKAVHLHTTYPIVLPLSCLAWPARTSAPPITRHYPSNRLIDRHCNRTALQFGLSAARIKHDSPASHQEEEVCRLHGQSLRLASALSRPRTKLLYIGSQPHSAGLRLACLQSEPEIGPVLGSSQRVRRLSRRLRMIGCCTLLPTRPQNTPPRSVVWRVAIHPFLSLGREEILQRS